MNSKLFYKDYEYDEEYTMIRVDAIDHIPTRVLGPQSCLRPEDPAGARIHHSLPSGFA
jgi:hypothetical protein